MDAIETIKANVPSVVLSVIYDSDGDDGDDGSASDVDGSGEENYHYSDKDYLIEEDGR